MKHIDLTNAEILQIAKNYSDNVAASKRGQKSKDGIWQVRRFAQKDWILNIRVYRYFRRRQTFEVALFRSRDHEDYIKYSGVVGGLIFLLSEAYNQTGRMAIDFLGPPEGENASLESGYERSIPQCVTEYLDVKGILISNRCRISDAEGRRIYIELSGLNEDIHKITSQREIDMIQLCFVSQRSIWTPWQIHSICKYAYAPEKIFLASVLPEHRLHFIADLYLLRAIYMLELLVNSEYRGEDELSNVLIEPIGQCQFNVLNKIKDDQFVVTVIPTGYAPQIADYVGITNSLNNRNRNIMVFPKDHDSWSYEQRNMIVEAVERNDLETKVSIDRISDVDHAITNKLKQSASSKKPPPIKAD
ncbi:MAG: hypothetical protein RPU91_16925 [Candidatus Sedimenticola sp. (ex Thyasira tokunagai)]